MFRNRLRNAVGVALVVPLAVALATVPAAAPAALADEAPSDSYSCFGDSVCVSDLGSDLDVQYGAKPFTASAPVARPTGDSSGDTCALLCNYHQIDSKAPMTLPAPNVAMTEAQSSASTGLTTPGMVGTDEATNVSPPDDAVSAPGDLADTALRDAAEVLAPITVEPADYQENYATRRQVSRTTVSPYRSTAFLEIKFSNGATGSCSGFFLSADLVGTAGHCLHDGRWATSVIVSPGENGSSPYGWCRAKNLYSVYGWTMYRRHSYDYGAVKLDCRVGRKVGWYGMQSRPKVKNDVARINGYPSGSPLNKPYATMWTGRGYLSDPDNTRLVYHRIQDAQGDSGAPILEYSCSGYCVVAIDTFTEVRYGYQRHNAGTRMIDEVIRNYHKWIKDGQIWA